MTAIGAAPSGAASATVKSVIKVAAVFMVFLQVIYLAEVSTPH
ncbi:hypothetical protein P262_01957 [Cronobacter malonaticus]|uniref:Uncharacterized protein n=1 Tax=Cronobacter malonaticus TaxID=413503 RepID=V5TXV8_9ENTR|nr:hypothetical protein P262_01957 [Cronobacter malonaticus]